MKNYHIFGVIGSKGHGKDTLAKYIKKYNNLFEITHFADPLKEMLMRVFGVTHDQLYTHRKEETFQNSINIDDYIDQLAVETGLKVKKHGLVARSARELLQFVGTDYIRVEDNDYWINEFLFENKGKNYLLCADIRFKNEAEAFKRLGATLIRIYKKGLNVTATHASEDFSDIEPDYCLYVNDGSLYVIDFAGFLLANGYIRFFKLYSYLSKNIQNKHLFNVAHFSFSSLFRLVGLK